MKEKMLKILNYMKNMLYPEKIKCIFCGRDIQDFDTRPYCDDCAKLDIFNNGNRCLRCDMHLPLDNRFCHFCQTSKRYYEKAFCPMLYKDEVRKAILKLKSDNAKYLAEPFASLIANRINEFGVKVDLILPVPMHEKSRKRRGYNQAERLAIELGKILACEVRSDLFIKTKNTTPQKDLKLKERIDNVVDSFALTDKKPIKDKVVLIVDDIMTTGATLNELARLCSPATKVYVAAIARDLPK